MRQKCNPCAEPAGLITALLLALPLCACAWLASCGYHVAGRAANLPANWHTIAVPSFVNRTPAYRIEQRVTNAVVSEFLARTKYHLVPSENGADAVLTGEITDIQVTPLLFDAASGHVTTMLVTMKLKVSLEDQQTKKPVYANNNFIFRDEYQVSGDVNRFFQEESPALDRMSRDFARDLVSAVLEGF
ncbi:MAG TPA: LptE family protein [Candidatus Acidoferrales bacterium]|nr:LptE family protein [Candidatus Acidoferrales bacterium]